MTPGPAWHPTCCMPQYHWQRHNVGGAETESRAPRNGRHSIGGACNAASLFEKRKMSFNEPPDGSVPGSILHSLLVISVTAGHRAGRSTAVYTICGI